MNFFATKVEVTPKTWDVHSEAEHSALTVDFLGFNEAGWIMLQINPRFSNNGIMARAVGSTCINMANPDEEADLDGKSSRITDVESTNSVVVEAEDIDDLLNHLSSCRCITEEDAQLISTDITKLLRTPLENASISTKTLSFLHDENFSNDQGPYNFVH
jgi:hypothetical protein